MHSSPPLPRRGLLGVGTFGIASIVLPHASAAASTGGVQELICDVPTLTAIPFLAQGSSTVVGDVTVTATVNTAIASTSTPFGFDPDGYLHAAGPRAGATVFDAGDRTTLTFSPGLAEIEIRTVAHADSGASLDEVYTFTGRSAAGVILFTQELRDVNTTMTVPAEGVFATGLAELEIVYSGVGTSSTQYASIVYLRMLAC